MSTPSTSPADQVKVVVNCSGDSITFADINLKLPRVGNKDLYQNTSIREDCPWRLQQIQDAGNHLMMAYAAIKDFDIEKNGFKNVDEIIYVLTNLIGCLQRSRSAIVNPKKRTLEELQKNKNVVSYLH